MRDFGIPKNGVFFIVFLLFLAHPFSVGAQTRGYGQGGRATGNGLEGELGDFSKGKGIGKAQAAVSSAPSGILDGNGFSAMTMEYQVHVLGAVNSPGTQRVSASVRVAEAVGRASGVAERGSRRHIQLRRSGEPDREIDLDRFLQKGDLNANPFLLDNDVIYVPFIRESVRIEGPVKKSGVYELSGEKNVWDIVCLAGGWTTGVSQTGEVVVVRYQNGKKELVKVPGAEENLKAAPIQNGDIIVIPHIFTDGKKFDYIFSDLPNDNVFFPSYNDKIYVVGAVMKQGPFEYQPHLTAQDYVNLAGVSPRARARATRVITENGKTIGNVAKHKLTPGDTILVPEKKLTGSKALAWYNTFSSTLFSLVALRSLIGGF